MIPSGAGDPPPPNEVLDASQNKLDAVSAEHLKGVAGINKPMASEIPKFPCCYMMIYIIIIISC